MLCSQGNSKMGELAVFSKKVFEVFCMFSPLSTPLIYMIHTVYGLMQLDVRNVYISNPHGINYLIYVGSYHSLKTEQFYQI